jgi:hypothetical protein
VFIHKSSKKYALDLDEFDVMSLNNSHENANEIKVAKLHTSFTPSNDSFEIKSVPPGYLVWSPFCKMMSLEPLSPDVMNLFKKEEYEPCSKRQPLTSIEQNFNNEQVLLIYHEDMKSKYLASGHNQIECCYQEITRSGANITADDKYS